MITQKEIAELLGISRTTVARALNGQGYVKKETKEKILQLAKEKEYEKNILGSSLASKRKKIFSFIVSSKNVYYTEQLTRGIREAKEKYKHYNVELHEIITDINSPQEQLDKLEEILKKEKKIAGLMIIPLDKEKVYNLLKPYLKKIKVVSLDTELSKSIPHVGSDYKAQGTIAAGILAKLLNPQEKILVIDNGNDNISSKFSLDGFLESIKKYPIEILGPYKLAGVKDSINFLKTIETEEIYSGLFINRYAQDILKELPIKYLKNKKIVTVGMGKRIKKLIQDGIVIATVAEDIYEIGHNAGQIIFEIICKNKTDSPNILPELRIYFLENLN